MIKRNELGKIQRMVKEIEPDPSSPNPEFHQKILEKFDGLTPMECAIIIEYGFEMQARKWQEQADAVSG